MDDWKPVMGAPAYIISHEGIVTHWKRQTQCKIHENNRGVLYVTIYDEHGRKITRSLAKLVADHFVDEPKPRLNTDPYCDTVMHIDLNKHNVHATNLAWRPRPFVFEYYEQMANPFWDIDRAYIDVETQQEFPTMRAVCLHYGIKPRDVMKCASNQIGWVFPVYRRIVQAKDRFVYTQLDPFHPS